MKKYLIALIIVAITLILTNPSQSDFENYVVLESGNKSVFDELYVCSRTGYFLFFSMYKSKFMVNTVETTYIGFFKNFIKISEHRAQSKSKLKTEELKIKSDKLTPIEDLLSDEQEQFTSDGLPKLHGKKVPDEDLPDDLPLPKGAKKKSEELLPPPPTKKQDGWIPLEVKKESKEQP